MKLAKHEDGSFTLTDETGAAIEIEDEFELAEAMIEFEKVLGLPDEATRYRMLERKIDMLMKTVEEMKACL